MRRHTDFSGYTRSLHMLKPDGGRPERNALAAFAQNESQFIFLFLKLAGAIDDEVVGKRWSRGPGWTIYGPSDEDIQKALKVML